MKRMMLGLEPFVYDFGILTEGYQHYTPWVLWWWGGDLQSANGHLLHEYQKLLVPNTPPKVHIIGPNTPFSGGFAQLSLVTVQEDAQS